MRNALALLCAIVAGASSARGELLSGPVALATRVTNFSIDGGIPRTESFVDHAAPSSQVILWDGKDGRIPDGTTIDAMAVFDLAEVVPTGPVAIRMLVHDAYINRSAYTLDTVCLGFRVTGGPSDISPDEFPAPQGLFAGVDVLPGDYSSAPLVLDLDVTDAARQALGRGDSFLHLYLNTTMMGSGHPPSMTVSFYCAPEPSSLQVSVALLAIGAVARAGRRRRPDPAIAPWSGPAPSTSDEG